jgi:hypothetical protein
LTDGDVVVEDVVLVVRMIGGDCHKTKTGGDPG